MSSRLERIRSKKARKLGLWLIGGTLVLIIVTIFWGLPNLARLAGGLINTDSSQELNSYELKPTPPIISDIPEATHSANVSITGYAQPGIDVVLYLNGAELGRKLTSESGIFNFANVEIGEGENSVYAYSATSRGLLSEKSKEYIILLDETKPTIEITAPANSAILRGSSERIVNIEGKVDEINSKVYVGERMAILNSEGFFSLPYQLIEGDQELMIRAIDKAGNETKSIIKLRWEP